MMKVFETQRLILSDWQDQDEQDFYQLNSHAMVMQYFPEALTKPQSDQLLQQIRQRRAEWGYGLYKLNLKQTGQFVGCVGLNHPQYHLPFDCPVEMAWRILPQFWHQGLAFEAASMVLKAALEQFKFDQMMAFTAEVNQPSQRLMQRLGMQYQQDFIHSALTTDHVLAKHVLYAYHTR